MRASEKEEIFMAEWGCHLYLILDEDDVFGTSLYLLYGVIVGLL